MRPETIEALMMCKAWLEFTARYKTVPREPYYFNGKGLPPSSAIPGIQSDDDEGY